MKDYLYDGTFEGFLTCVYDHYYVEKANGIYVENEYQGNLLTSIHQVITEEEKAKKVYQAIGKKISRRALQRVYKVYRSSLKEKENHLLAYLEMGFSTGGKIDVLHGEEKVFLIHQWEAKVNTEIHRMKGLLRFSNIDNNILYGVMEPDHDMVEFLGPHFADRLQEENFIIHDKKREKGLVSSLGHWHVEEMKGELYKGEDQISLLWKEYFQRITIKERKNPKCQKNFMPVRYWKNLTEKMNL